MWHRALPSGSFNSDNAVTKAQRTGRADCGANLAIPHLLSDARQSPEITNSSSVGVMGNSHPGVLQSIEGEVITTTFFQRQVWGPRVEAMGFGQI